MSRQLFYGMQILIIFCGVISVGTCGAAANNDKNKKKEPSMYRIMISVPKQRLYLYKSEKLLKIYPVSTAKEGTGSKVGSNQTPLGMHRVAEKIGANAPQGTVFVSRQSTGKIARIRLAGDPPDEKDQVTSRILWLEGMEEGVNKGPGIDSYNRCIYIHGTTEEGLIGRPASHGCVRMMNRDVIELFDLVPVGAPVDIIDAPARRASNRKASK